MPTALKNSGNREGIVLEGGAECHHGNLKDLHAGIGAGKPYE